MWVVQIIVFACKFLALSCQLIPKNLQEDLTSLIGQFNFRSIKVFHEDTGTLVSLQGSFTKSLYLSADIRLTVVKCGHLRRVSVLNEAVFYPLTREAHVCNPQETDQLLKLSAINRPLFLYASTETHLPAWLYDAYIPFDARVFVILLDDLNERWLLLQEIYHLHSGSELVVNALGSRKVDDFGELKWSFNGYAFNPKRRSNLRGSKIRTLHPSVIFEAPDSEYGMAFAEVAYILRTACNSLNASVEKVVWHNLNILTELLSPSVADIALLPMSIESSKITKVISFTSPYTSVTSRFFIRRPEFRYSLSSLMQSFSITVWYISGAILLTLSFAMTLISYASRMLGFDNEPTFCPTNCILMSLRIFCAQGWERLPMRLPGRVLAISSLIFGLFLNSLFVLKLQAGLSSMQVPLPFTGLETLVETEFSIFSDPLGIPLADIKEGTSDLMKKVQGMIRYYENDNDGHIPMNATCLENIALLVVPKYVDLYVDRFACPIVDTKTDLYFQWACLPTSHNYKFKKAIDVAFRRMAEGGIIRRTENNAGYLKWVPVDAFDFEVIELSKITPIFIYYSISLASSVVIFLLELACFKVQMLTSGVACVLGPLPDG